MPRVEAYVSYLTDLATKAGESPLSSQDFVKALESSPTPAQPRALTASVAYDRAQEFGIQYKTKVGKRGIGGLSEEQKAAVRKNRKPRSEKMKAFASGFEEMRREVPERFQPVVSQAEKGSLRAAIKLKCLDCAAYQPTEIKQCPITVCGLFPHRPYK